MFSLMVVALFFLMILTPCLFALRSRRETTEPAGEVAISATVEPSSPSEVVEASLGTLPELETEVLIARRALQMLESDLLAAEARLALAKARHAAEQAEFASRAAAQAALAAAAATASLESDAHAETRAEVRAAKTLAAKYTGPVVDGSNLPETHPSMDFPRSRVSRRAA